MAYINTTTGAYPLSEHDIKLANPNTSFPFPFEPGDPYAWVSPSPEPAANRVTHTVREAAPERVASGQYEQRWAVVSRFSEYTDAQGVTHTVAEQEAAAIAAEQASRDIAQATTVRNARDQKLRDSDWTQVADAPADKAAWATYRQALRDLTAQAGFPWTVEWPSTPT